MENAWNLELPVGYRFEPTEQELLLYYLYNKVNGAQLACNAVLECDLYGEEEAWRQLFHQTDERSLYFFTNLKNKTDNDSRIGRTTSSGCATWRNQNEKPIHYDGNVSDGDDQRNEMTLIGFKRTFSYVPKKKGSTSTRAKGRGHGWVMHEFRLAGCLLNNDQVRMPYTYVLLVFFSCLT